MVGVIFSIPAADPPSQKVKRWIQCELGVAFYRTLQGAFVFNTYLWSNPYFMIGFTCFLTSTIYHV